MVTRPAGVASNALCAAVGAAGYEVYSQPLLELQEFPELPVTQRQMLLNLDQYQHIIFISTNAVRFGMALVEDYWPQLPVGLNWFAIGSATAASLEPYGIEALTPGAAMTSEGLLALPLLNNVRDQRVLIVKGEGGRDTLTRELSLRGAAVEEFACYRRCVPKMAPEELASRLAGWAIDVIMISSGEGLANLGVLLSPAETTKLKHTGLIVPSERVAKMAFEAGFDNIVTAENASDAAMLHALKMWPSELESD
jgi:uroporphyrinogen-III synthase